jgi:molecular chaperone GrpE (heat shock protein)
MLNKNELNEFIDSFDYVFNKTELLLEELERFKNTDIQLKEEINNLKSLLAKFSNLEKKLKEDIGEVIKNEIEEVVKQNKKDLNKHIKIINYLLKKIEKLETFKLNCFYYFLAGFFVGLIPIILIYLNILKI